jgi:hypothetical protein
VRREDRFVLSHRPYALDLSSIHPGSFSSDPYIDAVWYRRRRGVTVACVGFLHLWTRQRELEWSADDPIAAIEAADDGRYGGTCEGRWDGERYWGAQEPDVIEQHLALLRPMLANYPEIPDGYDGWWTWQEPR